MLYVSRNYMATDTVVAVRVSPGQWAISHWRSFLFDDEEARAYVHVVWAEELRRRALAQPRDM